MTEGDLFSVPGQDKVASSVPKYCTAEALSSLIGISKKQISNLKVKGVIPSVGENKFLLQESVRAYCKYIKQGTTSNKTEIEAAKLEKMQRENAVASGELMAINEIKQIISLITSPVVTQMNALAARTTPEVAPITDYGEVFKIIDEESKRVLRAISGTLEEVQLDSPGPGSTETTPRQIN